MCVVCPGSSDGKSSASSDTSNNNGDADEEVALSNQQMYATAAAQTPLDELRVGSDSAAKLEKALTEDVGSASLKKALEALGAGEDSVRAAYLQLRVPLAKTVRFALASCLRN